MKYRLALLTLVVSVFTPFPANAQHGGFGGHVSMGHSGFGGGQSVGRVLGHHFKSGRGRGTAVAKGRFEEPPAAGAAMIHGRVVQLRRPEGVIIPPKLRFPRRPITDFGFGLRPGFFGFLGNSGFCGGFSAFPRRHFFSADFDCFREGFFFDPFFVLGFFPENFSGSDPIASLGSPGMVEPDDDQEPAVDSTTEHSVQLPGQAPPGADTLLQLTDGSMYGLTSYWIEGDRIHYITNYGGENAVPLARIDFGKTIELNAAQGVKFELRPRTPQRER